MKPHVSCQLTANHRSATRVAAVCRSQRPHRQRRVPPSYCGSKGASGSYDPQVGQAAATDAATAQAAQEWSQKYQQQFVAPLLEQMTTASEQNQTNLDKLYGLNEQQLQTAIDRYKQQGIPAEDAYYRMVQDYSSPAYAERQAQGALGDARTAEAASAGNLDRSMMAAGVSPNSPAAIAAKSDMAVQDAAVNANAETQARNAARNLGMSLKSDAANFGRGGQSSIISFGSAAQGNTNSSAANSTNAVRGAVAGGAIPLQGYNTAMSGANAQLQAYSNLDASSINANAQSASGLGGAFGQIAGSLLSRAKL